ncbi:MAG: hypothetical protein R3274_08760 [Desulfobacterales bacterium]|nr:hypothetical protein [Desulfobacterales bacterium]
MYFEAVFQPSNGTEYNSSAADFVGKKVAIHEGWTLEDGPHKGQQCFYIPNSTVGCIPESDLQQLKSIPFVQWKEIYNQAGLNTQ